MLTSKQNSELYIDNTCTLSCLETHALQNSSLVLATKACIQGI